METNNHFEVEIKSLLGGATRAEELRQQLLAWQPPARQQSTNSQLNHYFIGGNFADLVQNVSPYFKDTDAKRLQKLLSASNQSVRTRQSDQLVILVVKAAVDDTTSSNGTARLEFEAVFNGTLDELDQIILQSGYRYQAKWSRQREEYAIQTPNKTRISVAIDRNAGYGYLAEFEAVVEDEKLIDETKQTLRQLLQEFSLEELSQDHLQRMFEFYNENWPNYYGTDNTFTVE